MAAASKIITRQTKFISGKEHVVPFAHQAADRIMWATAASVAASLLQPEVTRAIKDLQVFQYFAWMVIGQGPRAKVTAAKSWLVVVEARFESPTPADCCSSSELDRARSVGMEHTSTHYRQAWA